MRIISNMIVKDQQFIQNFIYAGKNISDGEENEAFCYFEDDKGCRIFFRKTELPTPDWKDLNVVKKNLEDKVKDLCQEFERSKQHYETYILSYQELIISYPYACLIHEPIIATLKSILTRNLSYIAKISLMTSIAQALKNLHSKNLCPKSLNSSTIVIKNQEKEEFEIAFSKIEELNFNHKLENEVFGLGLVFFEILFSKPYIKGKGSSQYPKGTPSWITNFIQQMISPREQSRYHIKDIVSILNKAQICSETTEKFFKQINLEQ